MKRINLPVKGSGLIEAGVLVDEAGNPIKESLFYEVWTDDYTAPTTRCRWWPISEWVAEQNTPKP